MRLLSMAPNNLERTVVFELPYSKELENRKAPLLDLMKQFQPGRSFKLRRVDTRRMALIDAEVWRQWKKTFPCCSFDQKRWLQGQSSNLGLFLDGYFDWETMPLENSTMALKLVDVFGKGKHPKLLARAVRYLTIRWAESHMGPDRKDFDDRKLLTKLKKEDPKHLQNFWDVWENPNGNAPARSVGRLFQELFVDLPVTVQSTKKNTLSFLRARSRSSPPVTFRSHSCSWWPDSLNDESFPCIRHYDVSSPTTEMHEVLLPHMPLINSLSLYLDSSSNEGPLKRALYPLLHVENLDLSLSGELANGLIDSMIAEMQMWPLKELSLRVSDEYRESMPVTLGHLLPKLAKLKRLSLRGMDFPQYIKGQLSLESFRIWGPGPESLTEEAIAALRTSAPDLETLEVDGESKLDAFGERVKSARTQQS
jgi:hypothetical protein